MSTDNMARALTSFVLAALVGCPLAHADGPELFVFVGIYDGCFEVGQDNCIYFGAGDGQTSESSKDPRVGTKTLSAGLFDLTPGVIDRSNASAFASYGRIGASADAAVDNAPTLRLPDTVERYEEAEASARFSDRLTFTGGSAGEVLNLRVAIPVEGMLAEQAFPSEGHASASAWWSVHLGLTRERISTDPFGSYSFSTWRAQGGRDEQADQDDYEITTKVGRSDFPFGVEGRVSGISPAEAPLSELFAIFQVQSGRSYMLGMSISVGVEVGVAPDSASTSAYNHAAASANFLHTAAWGGVLEVTNSAGARVNDFQVTSGSGANYAESLAAAPIPEPSTHGLLLAGLCLLGLVRRRRPRVPSVHVVPWSPRSRCCQD
jgi:hypothetical protein